MTPTRRAPILKRMAAMRERASLQRGLPVLDRRGRQLGSVRRIGTEHLEVRRVLRPPLLVPLSAVHRLDRDGVHLDAVLGEISTGTLFGEGPPTEVAPVATIEQARSADRERWQGDAPTVPQQDHPATGD